MNELTRTFQVRRDSMNMWIVQEGGSRVHARSPYKDTVIDLARLIARRRAPSEVYVHSSEGDDPTRMVYRTPRVAE